MCASSSKTLAGKEIAYQFIELYLLLLGGA